MALPDIVSSPAGVWGGAFLRGDFLFLGCLDHAPGDLRRFSRADRLDRLDGDRHRTEDNLTLLFHYLRLCIWHPGDIEHIAGGFRIARGEGKRVAFSLVDLRRGDPGIPGVRYSRHR